MTAATTTQCSGLSTLVGLTVSPQNALPALHKFSCMYCDSVYVELYVDDRNCASMSDCFECQTLYAKSL